MSFHCLRPRLAYQNEPGEKPNFLKVTDKHDYEWYSKNLPKNFKLLLLPCGKCENCQKRKSQEWTARILKESKNYKYCYFITITYNDDNLRDLNKEDLQLFLKRYRFHLGDGFELAYYITGEYGETTARPHYHAIFLQNKPIKDLKFYANNLYISKSFDNFWKLGQCKISKQVTERSIKYTVAYTNKKIGETKIVLMSKGIGLKFLNDQKEAIKNHDGFYLVDGYKQKMPSYFMRKLKESSDPGDKKYLEDRENEPKPSRCLTGNTLGDLVFEFLESTRKMALKGKGEF